MASLPEELQKKIKGIAVTGWSRYDHFATLCELLPTALPSLAMCLQVLDKKCFHKEIQDNVSKELGYLHPLVMMDSPHMDDEPCGNFPGESNLGVQVFFLFRGAFSDLISVFLVCRSNRPMFGLPFSLFRILIRYK